MRESILCVSKSYSEILLSKYPLGSHEQISIDDIELWLVPRLIAESNEELKQIIPYSILVHDNRYLAYTRTRSGGDVRLQSKVSIGFGGHVNLSDVAESDACGIDFRMTLARAELREFMEELFPIPNLSERHSLGILYDDSNSVGRVHLGLIYLIPELSYVNYASKDPSIDIIGWLSKDELASHELESWSSIVLEHLHG